MELRVVGKLGLRLVLTLSLADIDLQDCVRCQRARVECERHDGWSACTRCHRQKLGCSLTKRGFRTRSHTKSRSQFKDPMPANPPETPTPMPEDATPAPRSSRGRGRSQPATRSRAHTARTAGQGEMPAEPQLSTSIVWQKTRGQATATPGPNQPKRNSQSNSGRMTLC